MGGRASFKLEVSGVNILTDHIIRTVILSAAPASSFRPAAFAGPAGAKPKDPLYLARTSPEQQVPRIASRPRQKLGAV